MTHRPLVTFAEQTTRAFLADRTPSELLEMWEATDRQRDDLARADITLGVLAAANLIDWIIDELEHRAPLVIVQRHALADAGHACDLHAMFAVALVDKRLWGISDEATR